MVDIAKFLAPCMNKEMNPLISLHKYNQQLGSVEFTYTIYIYYVIDEKKLRLFN